MVPTLFCIFSSTAKYGMVISTCKRVNKRLRPSSSSSSSSSLYEALHQYVDGEVPSRPLITEPTITILATGTTTAILVVYAITILTWLTLERLKRLVWQPCRACAAHHNPIAPVDILLMPVKCHSLAGA